MKQLKISLMFLIIISILSIGLTVFSQSSHITNKRLIEEEEMTEGVLYQYFKMDTSYNANDPKTERDVYTYTIKQSEYAHLATWTYSNPDDYEQKTLATIARDYEKNHPGWIVLGGINAEGYHNGEPTNAIIQDGEVIRKDVSAEAFKKLIGFKADGSVVIKQVPKSTDNPLLKVDDQKFDVTKVNELPVDGGISIITSDLLEPLNVKGYKVIEAVYSMFRTSKEFPNPNKTHSGSFLGIYLKGRVKEQLSIETINTSDLTNRRFYIVTNNEDVLARLTMDKEIKCEFEYVDEFSDVVSMTGYMYRYVQDGKNIPTSYVETNDVGQSIYYSDAYCTTTGKQRAGIGFKDDGTIVLLTSNTKREGPTQYEVGEMFLDMGCTNAYQFDGGGSVTFLKRDGYGQIEMLNTPGDGVARSIMTGLFIVARDPGLEILNNESDPSQITFKVKDLDYMKNAEDIKIIHDGKEFVEHDGKIVVDGLEENTSYSFTVSCMIDGVITKTIMNAKTQEYYHGITVTSNSKGFSIGIEKNYDNILTSKIDVYINGILKHQIDNSDGNITEYIIDDLNKDQVYGLKFKYEITTKDSKYYRETDEVSYQTLKYTIPSINEFLIEDSGKNLRVKMDYDDEDKRIVKVMLIINEQTYELETGENRFTFENYELDVLYKFQLVIKYLSERGSEKTIKTDIVKFIKGSEVTPPVEEPVLPVEENGCKKDIQFFMLCSISLLSIGLFIRKKR